MDKRRVTRRGALGLLASGACLTVIGSSGVTTVSGNRSTSLNSVGDASAYLSVENKTDASTPITLTNRTNDDMEVTLAAPNDDDTEFDVHDDGSSDGSNPTFSLLPGTGNSVDVDVLDDGTITVEFSADLLDGSGNVIGTIDFTRDVEAQTQAGQVQVTANVKSTGNSGKYEFELENTGSVDATLVGIGVRWTTNGNVAEVARHGGGDGIFTAEGTQVVSNSIPVDNSDQSSDTRRDFTQNVSLNQGVTKLFAFERFQTANGDNADMKDESVYITIYFEDGSSADKDLVP